MTPKEHQNKFFEIINEVSDLIGEITEDHQNGIFKRLLSLLNSPKYSFDKHPDGRIKTTSKNIGKARRIVKRLNRFFLPEKYKRAIERFSKAFSRLEKLSHAWFKFLSIGFKPKRVFTSAKDLAIEQTLNTINPEGFREALEIPIRDLLEEYIRNGGDFLELTSALDKGIRGAKDKEGDKVLRGYLDNYHWRNRITKDALFQYSRNYDQIVSNDLGFEWYLYSGNLVEDSRDFCEARAGKYFHIKEIRSWAKLSWQGKAAGTTADNIQTLLGGYNCGHDLRPVTLRLVPKEDVERARKLGFIE